MTADARSISDPPGDASPLDAAALLASWRERATTSLLWTMSGLGALMLLVYLPTLWRAGSVGIIVFSLAILGSDIKMAASRRWPLPLRAGWAAANLALSAVPPLFFNGDRGAIVGLMLGAAFTGTLLVGWRFSALLLLLFTVLIGGAVWGYQADVLPLAEASSPVNWNAPAAWAGLYSVLLFVAVLAMLATEQIFRQLRTSLAEQHAAAVAREQSFAALLEERARGEALQEEVGEARAEQEKLETTLHATLEELGAGFWEEELSTGTTTWSKAMYGLLGYIQGEASPSHALWRERIDPVDQARIDAVPIQPRFVLEYRVSLPGGKQRWMRSSITTVYDDDGAPTRLRGLLTDITTERETEQQLARLAEVAARTENAVVITDLAGCIEWVNEGFSRLTGWTLDEVRGRRPGDFLQGQQTSAEVKRQMGNAIANHSPFDVEVLNYRKDATPYWVTIESRLAQDSEGNPVGFVAIESDVTDLRVAHEHEAVAQRIAEHLLKSENREEASQWVCAELVAEGDLRIAQVWWRDPATSKLRPIGGTMRTEEMPAEHNFFEASRSGGGIPPSDELGANILTEAFSTSRTVVLDVREGTPAKWGSTARWVASQELGVDVWFVTPIRGPAGNLGVLEVGATIRLPGHHRIPGFLEQVVANLASFMLRDLSRQAFESIFSRSPDGLLLVDADGSILQSNERAEAFFGPVDGRHVGEFLSGGGTLVQEALDHADAPSQSGLQPVLSCEARGPDGTFTAELGIASTPSADRQVAIVSVRDLTDRHRMEQALKQSLREKETLLREVHHRVKNNLQIVSSLLTLQASSMEDGPAKNALSDMVLRVLSMSYVHQQLYGNDDFADIDLAEYAERLAHALQGTLDPGAVIHLAAEPVMVNIDVAVPCGLMLNELIANALKHGRSEDGTCTIRVELTHDDAGFVLAVSDQGPGVPAVLQRSGSLGMDLIRSLSKQLRASSRFTNEGGFRAELRVPLTPPT